MRPRVAPPMVLALCIAVAALAALSGGASGQYMTVDPQTSFIVDASGRARIFHGVNAVYKIPPWVADTTTYSSQYSLTTEDCANLASWGFTMVRLGVMWPGVATAEGVYNQTYLDVIEDIVSCLGAHGIYTLLDAHQDIFSRYFCGEGVPDWAVNRSASVLPFPQPIATSIPLEPNGYPNITACLSRGFADYYFSDAVASGFQDLYSNTNGLQTNFAGFWTAVATRFATNPYVLGYELINEPFAGDVYADPKLLVEGGYADKVNLAPMYEVLAAAIRAVDENHNIFFEPAVSDLTPTGLTAVPGGAQYLNRSVFSFHVYCAPTNASGDPVNVPECDAAAAYLFNMHYADSRKLGAGGFMTEMGAMLESPTETAALAYLLGLADGARMSWAYWQFKSFMDITTASEPYDESFYYADGSLQQEKVMTLSRTYAYAIAGVPTSVSFNPSTAEYALSFAADPSIAAPTEIFYNAPWYYPSGIQVAITPQGAATFTLPAANTLAVATAAGVAPGTVITVTVTPVS